MPHKVRGSYLTISSVMKFSDFTPKITGSPLLGEHTDEVLTELGYKPEQIAKLHEAKIVDPLPAEPGHHGFHDDHGWHDDVHDSEKVLK